MPKIPSFIQEEEEVVVEPPPPPPAPSPVPESGVDGALIGAGVAGAAVGGVFTDVLLGAAGVSMTGELLTDAAVVGAVGLGGAAAYAATRPDEAGEAARFVGGAVANTTSAYVELASVSAELAVLEQQQKAQALVDAKVAQAKALPGDVKASVEATVSETVANVQAVPKSAVAKAKDALSSVQSSAQSQLDAARKEIDAKKR